MSTPLYFLNNNEFMKRRIQLINSEAVLRIRELRQQARTLFPCVTHEMQFGYCNALENAKQIDWNMNFLLDMFQVDPLPSVSTEISKPEPPKGAA